MRSHAAALALLAATSAGADEPLPSDALTTPATLLAYVDTRDGVTRAEAHDIAQAYFLRHVGCGNFAGISEAPDAWVVEGRSGYAGEPIRGFLIDKRSGAISSPIGPSHARPEDMLAAGAAP